MPQPRIELTSVQLHLSWGTIIQDALPTVLPRPVVQHNLNLPSKIEILWHCGLDIWRFCSLWPTEVVRVSSSTFRCPVLSFGYFSNTCVDHLEPKLWCVDAVKCLRMCGTRVRFRARNNFPLLPHCEHFFFECTSYAKGCSEMHCYSATSAVLCKEVLLGPF